MPSTCSVGVLSSILCGLWSPGGGSCSGHQGIHDCAGAVKDDLSTHILCIYIPIHCFSYRHYILARSRIVVLILMHIFHMMTYQPTAGCPHSTECRARHSVYLWVWRYSCTQGKSSIVPPHLMTILCLNIIMAHTVKHWYMDYSHMQ